MTRGPWSQHELGSQASRSPSFTLVARSGMQNVIPTFPSPLPTSQPPPHRSTNHDVHPDARLHPAPGLHARAYHLRAPPYLLYLPSPPHLAFFFPQIHTTDPTNGTIQTQPLISRTRSSPSSSVATRSSSPQHRRDALPSALSSVTHKDDTAGGFVRIVVGM